MFFSFFYFLKLLKLQNLDIVKYGVYEHATTSDGSIIGTILNFNRPVVYASCVHLGTNPTVSFILDSDNSDLNIGKICFRSNYSTTATVGGRYIIIFKK